MQLLMSRMRAAMEHYQMIAPNDRIAVGVSGGKDSLALLAGLAGLMRFYPVPFRVTAVTLDPGFNNIFADYSEIEALCKHLGVEYVIRRTQLYHVIFEERKEKNPCSLCARMRRGILHDTAKELGCNKLALGHHADDAAETFFMNLLSGGTAQSFRPVTYLSRKDITVIRPMIFAKEKEVEAACRHEHLPVVQSLCPMDKHSEREKIKELIKDLNRDYPALTDKIIGALQKDGLSGW